MVTYKIIKDKKIVLLDISGDISYSQFVECFDAAVKDPDYSSTYNGIAVFRDDTKIEMSRKETMELAEYVVSNKLSDGKWAILADKPLETALSLIYQERATSQHEVSIFSTIEGASEYLDIDLKEILE